MPGCLCLQSCTTKELLVINRPAVLSICGSPGVLLLNAVLTVRAHQANSHKDKGWEMFTDAVVQWLSNNQQGLVFMLWGSYAQKKGAAINRVGLVCTLTLFTEAFYCVHISKFFTCSSLETPPCAAGCASLSLVCSPWFLWVQTFLQGQ